MSYDANQNPVEGAGEVVPGAPGAPEGQLAPHRGTMVLVFGILGIACCFIFGIVAWVMGNKDLQEIRAGRMDPSGEGLTNAGKICGIIGTFVGLAWFVLVVLAIMGGMFGAATSGGY